MDRAVLDAYGPPFSTLAVPPCEFLLDYEDEESVPGARARKRPWRFRRPDAFRDEVLALLLELNRQRAEEEQLAGPAKKVEEDGTEECRRNRMADQSCSDGDCRW